MNFVAPVAHSGPKCDKVTPLRPTHLIIPIRQPVAGNFFWYPKTNFHSFKYSVRTGTLSRTTKDHFDFKWNFTHHITKNLIVEKFYVLGKNPLSGKCFFCDHNFAQKNDYEKSILGPRKIEVVWAHSFQLQLSTINFKDENHVRCRNT